MISRKNIILFVACTAVFFEALDIAILNMAIPLMQRDFHYDNETMQWLQTAYVLCYGGFLILGGRLSDTIGKKKIFISGAALFLFTSLGAGLSTSFEMLLGFRALQGLAAAMAIPSAISIITNTFTIPEEKNKALGIFSAFAGIGSGVGLALGGIVATYMGWHWVFFINVPVIAVVLVLAFTHIEADQKAQDEQSSNILSGVILTLVIILLSYFVHEMAHFGEQYAILLPILALIIAGSWFFIRRESNHPMPLINFSLFKHQGTIVGNVVTFLLGAFFLGYLLTLSMYLQQDLHFPAVEAGLMLFPFSICSALTSKFILPRLFKAYGILRTAVIGMLLMCIGALLLITAMLSTGALPFILLSLGCVTGTGMAISYSSLTVLALQDLPQEEQGLAAGVATTAYFFGGGLGLSIIALAMQLVAGSAWMSQWKLNINLYAVVMLALFALIAVVYLVNAGKKLSRS